MIFCLNYFCLEKWGILKNLLFDKIRSRIQKNELTYKFYTILEWDKYQQFADLIKFLVFWFALSQMWKTFVLFFMHQTLSNKTDKYSHLLSINFSDGFDNVGLGIEILLNISFIGIMLFQLGTKYLRHFLVLMEYQFFCDVIIENVNPNLSKNRLRNFLQNLLVLRKKFLKS